MNSSARSHQLRRRRRRDAIAGALIGLVALAACSSSGSAHPTPTNGDAVDLTVPTSVQNLRLHNQDGRVVTLDSLHGKTVVISPSLTLCQETCPLISANLRAADDAVRAAGLTNSVEFVEVTVDPQRDDQKHLKAYQGLYGASPDWEFLGGTSAQIAAFWNALHLSYGKEPNGPGETPHDWLTGAPLTYDVSHQNIVYVLRPNGHVAWLVNASPDVRGQSIPTTLEKFLSEQGNHNVADPDNPSWTPQDVLQAIQYVTGKKVPDKQT